MTLPYIYRWDRQGRKGQACKVTVRSVMNSCLVEFADGYTMVTSRSALMKKSASGEADGQLLAASPGVLGGPVPGSTG